MSDKSVSCLICHLVDDSVISSSDEICKLSSPVSQMYRNMYPLHSVYIFLCVMHICFNQALLFFLLGFTDQQTGFFITADSKDR